MWLPYEYAFEMALVLAVAVVVLRRNERHAVVVGVTIGKELAIVLTLYGVWQYIRARAVTKTAGAIDNAHQLWRLQRWLHLPSEVALQRVFIDDRPLMWFLNVYYGGVHVPAAGALLVWVFWRHRDSYSAVRATFALTIAGCLTIQALLPMAPPRFLTDLGFVDAAIKYGMSVYGTGGQGISNEVAAMPSLHVGWALLVGVGVVLISTSRWRWLALLHPFFTIMSVTITANHWWLDGIVAGMIVGLAYALQLGARTVLGWLRIRYGRGTPLSPGGSDADVAPVVEPALTQVS